MATFENPNNGYREDVGGGSVVLALLFGWFYFVVKGLWSHVLIQAIVVVALAVLTGGPGALIAVPLWIGYAVATPSILRARYLRTGWREV